VVSPLAAGASPAARATAAVARATVVPTVATVLMKKVGTSRTGKRFARRQLGSLPRALPDTICQ
jgi:hypothetical protein